VEEDDGATPLVSDAELEINQILGLFDVPAFARRGSDLEFALKRLRQRIARERAALLDMVHVRLRQWAGAATSPDDWADAFAGPIVALWQLSGADRPVWAEHPTLPRRRRALARDLTASVVRFNRRWLEFLERLTLESINRYIDDYNRYYVLEKECVMGSARLAARHFVPEPRLTREGLLTEFPTLPVPSPLR
jgi:hypothetical protein